MTRRALTWTVFTAVVSGFALAQLIPAARTNPPSHGDLVAPPPVAAVLRRACYDCHSNATRWPWYSGVAPLSWMFVSHVTAGRMQVNFSEWGSYYPKTRRRKLQWMGRALSEARMPPWYYRLLHPAARLRIADRVLLEQWIASGLATKAPPE